MCWEPCCFILPGDNLPACACEVWKPSCSVHHHTPICVLDTALYCWILFPKIPNGVPLYAYCMILPLLLDTPAPDYVPWEPCGWWRNSSSPLSHRHSRTRLLLPSFRFAHSQTCRRASHTLLAWFVPVFHRFSRRSRRRNRRGINVRTALRHSLLWWYGGRFYASTWAASNDYDYDYGF